MHNTAATSPLVSENFFARTIKELVDTVDGKLTALTHNINLNTDKRIEESTDTLTTHATNIHSIMSAMALEFQHSNNRIHNIMQTLAASTPDPPNANLARLPHTPTKSMVNAYVGDPNTTLAPPGFSRAQYRSPSSSLHKDQQYRHD